MKTHLVLPCLAAVLVAVSSSAQSPEDIRVEISKLEDHARQAKNEGRMDEVRELTHQLEKLRQAGKMAAAKREIEELHQAGKREEAERLERKLVEMHEVRGPDKKKAASEGEERLHHLGEAIRNLQEAGLGKQAEDLEKLATHMKEEMARHARDTHSAGVPEAIQDAMARNKAEMQAMREQMQKLAHAIEELRSQLHSQKPGKP